MLSPSTGATSTLSTIFGPATSIRVAGGVFAARFAVTGRAADVVIGGSISPWNANDGFEAGSIGRLVIGGSVYGGLVADSGRVFATRGIDRLVIRGDLVGGTGTASGVVLSGGQIGFARVGGSIAGNSGESSGVIAAAGITRLVVGASIGGGVSNPYSGRVFTSGAIGSAVVGGSIVGGADFCGGISAGAGIGSITIGGDLAGGVGYGSGSVSAGGRIGSLQVNRIQSGSGLLSGSVGARSLGRIAVRTDILGSSAQPVFITGLGAATPTGPRALDSLTVGGSMDATLVLGGYNGPTPRNGAARIGTVTVRGNMIGSSVVAGVENRNPVVGGQFGDGFDVSIAGRRGSRIDSLVVNGQAQGSVDLFQFSGVLANSIGTVRVGGRGYAATRAGITPTSPNLQFRLI